MKIIICCSKLSGGGAERVAVSWANGLTLLDNKVLILTDLNKKITYKPDSLIQVKDLGVGRANNIGSKILRRVRVFRTLFKQVREFKPDVILLVEHLYPLEALIVSKLTHTPIILTDHNSFERPKSAPMNRKTYFNKFFLSRAFDHVTCLTHVDKEIMEKHGIENVSVLYNPLFLKPTSSPDDLVKNKQKIILAAGRIDQWHYKGFDLLLKAWDHISPNFPDWKLQIMGYGSPHTIDWLKSTINNPDRVEFIGLQKDVKKKYQEASIFVLSSRYEGWGLVMVEAMSQCCATIACDYKGRQSEVIFDKETGLLCKPEDINELEKKISILLEDENLRHTLQINACRDLYQFEEKEIAIKLEKIIKNTIKK